MDIEVPEGVQAFNLWTLLIMARMWEEFPRPQWFNSNPKAVQVTRNPSIAGGPIGLEGPEQVALFTHTLNWLIDEGFASGTGNAAGAFAYVRLTTKGFSVLNQVPRSLGLKAASGSDKPLGALIREAAVKHTVEAAATLIQKMLLPNDP
jgi:hypothetical protein